MIEWLAGLFEGEGSISKRGELVIGMTNEQVVRRAHTVSGVGTVTGPYWVKGKSTKPWWRWAVYKQADVQALGEKLYPHLSDERQAKLREISRSVTLKSWNATATEPTGNT